MPRPLDVWQRVNHSNTKRWNRKWSLVSSEEQPSLSHVREGVEFLGFALFFSLIALFVSIGTLPLVTGQWSVSGQPGREFEGVPAACVGTVISWYYWWMPKRSPLGAKWPCRHWSVPNSPFFPAWIWLLNYKWTEAEIDTALSPCQTLQCSLELQTRSLIEIKPRCQGTQA